MWDALEAPAMIATLTVAVMLSQSPEQISSHVLTNIKNQLRGASSSALVTVMSAADGRVKLQVDQAVIGDVPAELDVTAAAFNKRDVEPGTQLLVFFRNDFVPTGNYESVCSGKIREYEIATYVDRVKVEAAARTAKKPQPKSKPVADSSLSPRRGEG
jgi:hypothetical protein